MLRPSITSPALHDKIKRALQHGGDTHTVDDVLDAVAAGMMAWLESDSGESVIVAELLEMPRRTYAHAFIVAGNMGEIIDELHPRFALFGRQHGADALTASGRAGWTRSTALASLGWKNTQHVMAAQIAKEEA